MNAQEKHIITVDEDDNVVGEEDKEKCHDGDGILHRAFLAMVIDGAGKLLLTRRSGKKRLWPGFWDGSVASHLYRGEDYERASVRRLREEIGLVTDRVHYAFKFRYKAGYNGMGTEHEICAVTIVRGIETDSLVYDPDEISETKLVDVDALKVAINEEGHFYTPWLVLAIQHMGGETFSGF